MANHPRIFLVALLAATLLLPSSVFAASSVANVGNWVGKHGGDEIEVAVWFASDPVHSGYVRGYVLSRDDHCAAGLFGFRVMGRSTTFFGVITDRALADDGFELELRRIESDEVDSTCSPLKFLKTSNRIFFVYEPERGLASLGMLGDPPLDENRYTNLERVMTLKRSTPSATMLKVIAANPLIANAYGDQSVPSASIQSVIKDPNLDPVATIPQSEIPCRVLARDQQVRGFHLGIVDIASTREPGDKIGVRYKQYSGPLPSGIWSDAYRASEEDRYVQLDASAVASPSHLNLRSSVSGLKLGPDSCVQAAMVDSFLTALERDEFGSSSSEGAVAEVLPRIEDADDLYFFDVDGIDQIRRQKMSRVYGTTTLFVPGDLSREGQWSPDQQSMKLRAMVKHSNSGYIEKDLLSRYNEVSFFYDEKLSKAHGTTIWVSVADERQGGICTRWREKHFVDNCAEHSTANMHKSHRYYMTEDLAAAKAIFHKISPNATTLSAAELADPTRRCARGVFCDYPGGVYLNAVYDGDFDRVQHLDEQLRNAGIGAIDKLMPGEGLTETEQKVFRRTERAKSDAMLKNLLISATVPPSSLPFLAKRYMYQYQSTSQACFEPGHRIIEKEWIIPATRTADTEYDGFIIPGDIIPGSRMAANYDVNPEFFSLCDRVCDAVKPTGRTMYLTNEDRTISNGLDKVLTENHCASSEVQQFESNLIKLTNRALNEGPRKRFVERSSL